MRLTSMRFMSGQPSPLGASLGVCAGVEGVNFAVAAPQATAVTLCLYATPTQEIARFPLTALTHGVWHGFVAGLKAGALYGYRVDGPWCPAHGLRFNPHKLLLDPYAFEVVGSYQGQDSFLAHDPTNPSQISTLDNGSEAVKARVMDTAFELMAPFAGVPVEQMVIYEAHVKGLTQTHPQVPKALQGTYAGLAHPAVLDHLCALGVTSLSLMPVHAIADEPRLLGMGLKNYWGYNPLAWMAPEPRYASGQGGASPAQEFRAMVQALHARGIEVLLDVVFNHSAESDEHGPTFHLRGLDNAGYYHLHPEDASKYENWTGCGNSLNAQSPFGLRLMMDALRHWVLAYGVDGFRFDLATVLGRHATGWSAQAPFYLALQQDPVLCRVKWVAEPWDIGWGGYQLGHFPAGWMEWNDRFRDMTRRFWLDSEHPPRRGDFAQRLAGSSACFHHGGRMPTASINLITAHDGMTLRDLLSYNTRHNQANGEDNRDGHSQNWSHNCGEEGASLDPTVLSTRQTLTRTLLANLFFAQGTPLLLAGDELGRTQKGNNNAYCQDNDLTWVDWANADAALLTDVRRLIALRKTFAALRHPEWWHVDDAVWWHPEGQLLVGEAWQDPHDRALALRLSNPDGTEECLLLINPHAEARRFVLPPSRWDSHTLPNWAWRGVWGFESQVLPGAEWTVAARTLCLAVGAGRHQSAEI